LLFGYRRAMKLACVWVVVAVLGCSKKKQDAVVSSEPPPPTAQQASPPAPAAAAETPAPPPKLADNAPQDQPKTGRHTPEQEQRIAELSKQSMAKFPDAKARFNRGLPAGEHMFVTTTLSSPGKTESVFIAVTKIAKGKVSGTIASDIINVTGFAAGQAYELPESAITDWMIAKPDGSEEGNLVGKYLDTI
jgi:hypothetical protein